MNLIHSVGIGGYRYFNTIMKLLESVLRKFKVMN